MYKVGFIDYFLDEWHANNYPAWIREASAGSMEAVYAYGEIDSPKGGLTTDAWCKKMGMHRCGTIEELIEKSDALVVLSPDNCERHEALCQLPLCSGKRTYVDKTFAPDGETARRMFALAEKRETPCWSASALRFAPEYAGIKKEDITAISSWGGGGFENYLIHQLEPLMMLMQERAGRVLYLPGENWYTLAVEFVSGRTGMLSGFLKGSPFMMNISGRRGNLKLEVASDYFRAFIKEMTSFFNTGKVPVPPADTLAIMQARGAAVKARERPGEWVWVES